MTTGLLVLGNQLFDPKRLEAYGIKQVFMREDFELCSYFKFHKLKIVFFLAAMRTYRDELSRKGFLVSYQELIKSEKIYELHFLEWLKNKSIKKLFLFEIEDKFFNHRIMKALKSASVDFEILPSPMFLTSCEQFKAYLSKTKRPFMKTFYESQRKRLDILIESEGKPHGGQWTFDEFNRKPLPNTINPPEPKGSDAFESESSAKHLRQVLELCQKHFSHHPGELSNIWFPVSRLGAQKWLRDFVDHRLAQFGPYEDALTTRSDFVFHSGLSPFLNTGLLTPAEVVQVILTAAQRREIPLASVEGFIRQVIGWREFIRGIYHQLSDLQETRNFWNHQRKLSQCWYDGTTGIEPLDQVIKKVRRIGYAHHIERLMVIGNLMVLLEIHPKEAYRWYMEMFIDSSDWVMGPNVFGMGIFSDGGLFATKPYICGSNYYRKMGDYRFKDWHNAVDGLYWSFIEKHQDYFLKNPRLAMMVRSLKKIEPGRKKTIYSEAENLRNRLTVDVNVDREQN